ncbi:ABC transporter ATP-binding protein [Granulosicoccus antarcticus]|uniref:sn-glycerol-3-phosphate import ATP-binding protein UgpC n=1 Tax=Granulosicoccus antarcticus IMCC3135 TaxID=1192854 RepID=A0A2Z2NY06_9GAMM|nr:sn-glycerol-3-phosphate ABC transporter ATP-binding protein UgpC [Granulosicoccus antarcticus]ASJ73720.1 sn-glycerol-3-phosphate import ATP-binding protein UgpC [Granulosicoccus antarcticus IMCC3135]
MAKLEISQLKKRYGRVEVIHGVDMTVEDGEFVSLIGSSGCGKSTMLRMIAGLESVSSGSMSLDGRLINSVEPKDRDIAMVFQNYALYPHLSVAQNMGFSLELRKVPKKEAAIAVAKAAEMLGLTPYLDRTPKALSGGQRQRVAMGRAIVRNPRLFLFDEPLSNLDAKLRVQMRMEIKALQKRLGTTSIYVTHDQVEALTMSDRVVLLNAGRVEQIGTPMQVYKRPANVFVATFIGSPAMNLLSGTLLRDADQCFAKVDGKTFALPECEGVADGTSIKLGVRPEHLRIVDGPDAQDTFNMSVEVVETTGAETHVYGCLGADNMTVTLDGEISPTVGETIRLQSPTKTLHVFDAASGARLNS